MRYWASIAAACRSAITRMRLTAATAACLAAVVSVSVPGPLAGQDASDWAVGTWAGSLDAGDQQLRIVFDISRGEDDTLRGSMVVPTQGASDIPLNELGVEARTLSMSFPVPGHSDGALAARRGEGIAFLVMLAGSGLPGVETAADQVERLGRAGGAPEEIVAMNRRLYGELARVAADPTGDGVDEARLRKAARSAIDELSPELRRRAFGGAEERVVEQLVGALGTPWTRFTLRHDPRETLGGVRVPVLALVGEKDLQLASQPHLSAISGALARGGNDNVTVRGMPGLNHLLQEAESGSPSEFARVEQMVAPAALQLMSDWIAGRAP